MVFSNVDDDKSLGGAFITAVLSAVGADVLTGLLIIAVASYAVDADWVIATVASGAAFMTTVASCACVTDVGEFEFGLITTVASFGAEVMVGASRRSKVFAGRM